MPLALIETGHCNVDLKPSPIEPSWILEGNPKGLLARAVDQHMRHYHDPDRQTLSFGLGYAVRAINKLKRMFFVPGGHPSAPQRDPTPLHDLMGKPTRDHFSEPRKTHNVN
ncbi:hypothetical protein [Bradyrhizobium valentinum]|uniref:Uncharacterized protein n=1 Tax=Bradyrhizobium valentinum TaxID=1518501 RepID=A0A0R3LSD4_9BRAD|nr:hypothetical protein [Bradyrhizobium valentinum]KRR10825.1 hypothetical protein CP49_22170 [Bradyrhizobium valentinum]